MTFLRWSAALLVLAVATLTGCSSGDPQAAAPGPSPEPSVSASSAPPPPPAPKVGECHALSVTEATDPVDPTPPVPCRGPHTSVTVKVGELQLVVDGHQLAVDSKTVRKQIADACPASPAAFVGGDQTTQRLSRFEVVWFSPSLEQADAGANWYRCDVVALRSEGSPVQRLMLTFARMRALIAAQLAKWSRARADKNRRTTAPSPRVQQPVKAARLPDVRRSWRRPARRSWRTGSS